MELDLTDEQVKAIRLLESIGCTIIFNGEIRKDSVKKCDIGMMRTYCGCGSECKYCKHYKAL